MSILYPKDSPTSVYTGLQASTGILEQQSDGAVVDMFSAAQLAWLDLAVGREGRVVEQPHGGEVMLVSFTHGRVGLCKVTGILKRQKYQWTLYHGDHSLPSSLCVLEGKGNSSIEDTFSLKL